MARGVRNTGTGHGGREHRYRTLDRAHRHRIWGQRTQTQNMVTENIVSEHGHIAQAHSTEHEHKTQAHSTEHGQRT